MITAPGDPGDYELRYIHFHSKKVIGRADIKVTPVKASLQIPASVKVGATFDITWKGPGGYDDFLTIALPSQAPNMQVSYASVYGGSPLKMTAPQKPGTYEVRYILFTGRKLLGKTTIEVIP